MIMAGVDRFGYECYSRGPRMMVGLWFWADDWNLYHCVLGRPLAQSNSVSFILHNQKEERMNKQGDFSGTYIHFTSEQEGGRANSRSGGVPAAAGRLLRAGPGVWPGSIICYCPGQRRSLRPYCLGGRPRGQFVSTLPEQSYQEAMGSVGE